MQLKFILKNEHFFMCVCTSHIRMQKRFATNCYITLKINPSSLHILQLMTFANREECLLVS